MSSKCRVPYALRWFLYPDKMAGRASFHSFRTVRVTHEHGAL